MNTRTRTSRSPFLPVGIAMTLMAAGFTFDGNGGLRWLWAAQPVVAAVLAATGVAFIGGWLVQRVQRPAPGRRSRP